MAADAGRRALDPKEELNARRVAQPAPASGFLEKLRVLGFHDLDELLDETSSSWQNAVGRQGRVLTGMNPPDGDDEQEVDDWITSAVRAFCRRHGLAQRYHADVFGGGES